MRYIKKTHFYKDSSLVLKRQSASMESVEQQENGADADHPT